MAAWQIMPCLGLTQTGRLQPRTHITSAVPVAKSEFDIPAAPILIPKGPWKAVDGSVNAPKGFKAQGQRSPERSQGWYLQVSARYHAKQGRNHS